MAKRPPADTPPRFAIDPALRRYILLAAGCIAILVGLVQLWDGAQTWLAARGGAEAMVTRDRLARELADDIEGMRARFALQAQDGYVRADAAAGALDDAAGRIAAGWPELRNVRVFSATLDEAFADPAAVGWGRMSVLSSALVEPKPAFAVVGKRNELTLAMAVPLRDEVTVGVAYGELPLQLLTRAISSSGVRGGYLQLASAGQVLVDAGDVNLRAAALPVPVGDSGLRIAAAKPEGGEQIMDVLVPVGIGVVALVLGVVVLLRARPAKGPAEEAESHRTLAEMLASESAEPAASAEPPKSGAAKVAAAPSAARVDRSIFRAYDIRGVLGYTLDSSVAFLIGQAVGSLMQERGLREIVVGRDGRLSGPELCKGLIDGLRLSGCDVIDIGMVPTPVVYFATYQLHTGSGIAVTGSHNPPNYNGFKIMVGGDTLSGDAIQALYARIAENNLSDKGGGGLQVMDMASEYLARISSDIQLERQIKVVVDAGNGVAGGIAPQVLEAIGCEVEELYCEVDGNFPNHHPDPSDPQNLLDLATAVKRTGAELGIAFDGDGDRLGVVTRDGEVIFPDRLLMLFAQDVLTRNPGACIIYDVKCTGQLAGQVLRHGGSPIMWKTGHSLIKAKMRETEAELAGEMSGHFFFRERWYGFDDGMYAGARLLEILSTRAESPEEVFATLPQSVSTPELKIAVEEGEQYRFVEQFVANAKFEGARIATIDGLRADWPDGWGLVRASNTTPVLVLRFDGKDGDALQRIKGLFREQLLAIKPDLALPF